MPNCIGPVSIADTVLPVGVLDGEYDYQLPISPVQIAATILSGTLPAGVILTPEAILFGIPTEAGVFPIVVGAKPDGEECFEPIPLLLIILEEAEGDRGEGSIILDNDPLPTCIQEKIEYRTLIHVTGSSGTCTGSISPSVTINNIVYYKPDGVTLEQISATQARLIYTIPVVGTYFIELNVVDALDNRGTLVLRLVVVPYCGDMPTDDKPPSARSTPVFVKESWARTNMVNLLPEVLIR